MYVMTKKKVLLLGIDPNLIDSNLLPTDWDANRVKAAAEDANKRLTELGYEVQVSLVDLGEIAESIVSDTLSREKFDCIMIGAGFQFPYNSAGLRPQSFLRIGNFFLSFCKVRIYQL